MFGVLGHSSIGNSVDNIAVTGTQLGKGMTRDMQTSGCCMDGTA